MASSKIQILPSSVQWLASFCQCIDSVVQERRFMLSTQTPRPEKIAAFIESMQQLGNPQFLALDGETVVGWCDLRRLDPLPTSGPALGEERSRALGGQFVSTATHPLIGELGMGVIKTHRNQGLGRRLIETCEAQARDAGFHKIQLRVFKSNQKAVRFYQAAGFHTVDEIPHLAVLDGVSQDAFVMAKFLDHRV